MAWRITYYIYELSVIHPKCESSISLPNKFMFCAMLLFGGGDNNTMSICWDLGSFNRDNNNNNNIYKTICTTWMVDLNIRFGPLLACECCIGWEVYLCTCVFVFGRMGLLFLTLLVRKRVFVTGSLLRIYWKNIKFRDICSIEWHFCRLPVTPGKGQGSSD